MNNQQEWIIAKRKIPKEIAEFITELFELMEIRGRVGIEDGVEFFVRSNEQNHSIPHVHAKYAEYQIEIAINDGVILSGNLPKGQQKLATEWVLRHQEKLKNEWNTLTISAISHLTKSRLGTPFE